ncbi:DNA-protecting protein DprA [Faecalicatena contorta]|uniref:DNA-processing protein DprA n=1 Tax=Faecalicatena contorta TaxID=39482 RepID=UPI001F3B99F3|nr:DNA-processing protein DprA [Faecalicatena contorta]MCF2680764.1 DNA-protecting protein DprA [Faecalicatena contorta]
MIYEYWFASIKSLSSKKKIMFRECMESAKAIYYIEETRLEFCQFLTPKDKETIKSAQKQKNLEEKYRNFEKAGIRFIPYFSPEYPKRLQHIDDMPYALYVKGMLPREEQKTAAIVGARKCTSYGEALALEYGETLARAGIQVISGMARGIDGAGQRGALNGGGSTYGVLGCGVDICYPREHIGLYADIQRCGGLISEQCMGEPPLPAYFPQRNRIISGLSDIVLVMEARVKSGSLITADLALEQGKDVYALPGPVTSPLSQGCHYLIRQGAGILLTPQDLLEELHMAEPKMDENSDKNEKVLETPEYLVYSKLDLFPKSISSLIEETGISPDQLMGILSILEIEGKVREISKNYYIKARK